MKKALASAAIIIHFALAATAQDIRIYHGTGGNSAILRPRQDEKNFSWSDTSKEVRKRQNSIVEIVVMNANPFLYSYELKLENYKTTDETPDFSMLLNTINALPGLSPKAPIPLTAAPKTMSELEKTLESYQNTINKLNADLDTARKAIAESDIPEGILNVFARNEAGFLKAKKTINALPASKSRFNSPTLLADLNQLLDDAAKQATKDDSFKLGAYYLVNAKLVETVTKIRTLAKESGVIRFYVKVSDTPQKIKILIKKKDESAVLSRDLLDNQVCILRPFFKRPALEIVPVVNLTYTTDVPEFSIADGVITEQKGDGFKFKAGAMLLYNFWNFGKYKEGAWGIGLGYNIPKEKIFESFYLGTMVSYKSIFRVGAGFGFSDYPSALKAGAGVGSGLPADIKNLEDIIEYRRKPSLFITFSISGIKII